MKRNFIIKGIAAVMVSVGLAGCSSDYLQTEPVTSTDASLIQTTEEGAQAALYGLCRSMYSQYTGLDGYHSVNGEPWLAMFYGDIMGQDYFSLLWAVRSGSNYQWSSITNYQGWVSAIPWRMYYNFINQANVILDGIDNVEGDENNLKLIHAQALTMRAFAYTRLMQLFAPRWEDSDNGERKCIVLRDHESTGDSPLVTCNQIYNFIYKDLNDAIALYKETTSRRKFMWEPNLSIAQGIFARVAMLKHDYPTAEKMAHDARQDYPIMSAEEFAGGFAEPNKEWMWCNAAEVEGIYYWAHGSWYSCQGPYPTLWGLGAGAINYELYKQIPDGDIRAEDFFTPDKPLRRPLTKSSFWNKNICIPADMNLMKNSNMRISITAFGTSRIPNGDKTKWGEPYVARQDGGEDEIRVCFGAQYKFWCLDQYGTNSYPMMRGAEMLLTEAEAAYHNGNTSVTTSCLKELNDNRNPNYSCNKTGDALLEEVRLQRRIELWGEGHSWFDFKRWSYPMVRNTWKEGDTNSNNIPQAYYLNRTPADCNGWRYTVPQAESQYNHAIDRSELNF